MIVTDVCQQQQVHRLLSTAGIGRFVIAKKYVLRDKSITLQTLLYLDIRLNFVLFCYITSIVCNPDSPRYYVK
jgi:hypothetical protein